MNNFFYSSSDYDLFKKALRSTKNEPVIINILSDDSSLVEGGETAVQANAQRKQMSSKFQASPFDKFFGPRKKRTDPLDMKDFSSWRNKNYRESEKQINDTPEETTKFSFSDYLNARTKDKKFNSEDEIKTETQKSIEQMASSDSNYQKFSLDSYLNKLERQTKAKKDFAQTDDLVKDFVSDDSVMNSDLNQDENFMASSDVNVEDLAMGGEIKGDKFSFDREELDIFRARLDKMEREANNIKDKPTTKVISTNELSEVAKGDDDSDEFNLDKLGIEDDIERVNQKLDTINKVLGVTGDDETEKPKVEHQKFVEIKKTSNETDSKTEESVSETSETKDLTVGASASSAPASSVIDVSESSGTGANVTINVNGSASGTGSSATATASSSASKADDTTSLPARDMSGKTIEVVGGTGGAGVVKPVIIAGATAKPEELKETDETSSDAQDSFVDALGIIDEDGVLDESEFESGFDAEFNENEIKKTDEYITKTDLRNVTDEIIGKFSEMSRGNQTGTDFAGEYDPYLAGYDAMGPMPAQQTAGVNPYAQTIGAQDGSMVDGQTNVFGVVGGGQGVDSEYKKKQDELQAQLMELIEQNKRTDEEVSKKLEQAEKEKMRVAEEYEKRLRELEDSMLKREEAVKQQAYIEKLKNDIKFKKSENKYKLREEQIRESEKSNSQTLLDCEKLKAELRNSLSVSNLEMDKKLLECVNGIHKAEIEKQEQKVEELEQDLKEEIEKEKPATPKRAAPKRRASTVRSRMRTRTPRRKIDSDIIGGINFD